MEYYLNPNSPQFMADTDSQSIQNAVNAAENGPVRTVIIPRRNNRTGNDEWMIDKTILLPSDITVILDDCHLTLVEGVYENIFRNKNMYTEIAKTPDGTQHDIRITGRGNAVLDGGKGNDLRESTSRKDGRPHVRFNNFVLLNNVTDYVLENFKCINLRWWAINQIYCRRGRLSNLSFFNGDHIPNQDGINLRIGCSDILIENITGRTGDDVVALTALPKGSDRELVPDGGDVDIHDVTIRNVSANTKRTIVALRNHDGAKLYRVNIENIRDIGGYSTWGVVRIGENNWYRERLSELGETYEISIRGVYSLSMGTVSINSTLMDSSIRDVYAGGTSMAAISTYARPHINSESGNFVKGGVTMKNVLFENIHYNGTAGHNNEGSLTEPGKPYNGCALDFRSMRDSDTLERVVFRDVFARDGAELWMADDRYVLDVRN